MRASRWFLGAGLLCSLAYLAVPDGVVRAVVYDGIGLASVVAMLVGIERHRPPRLTAWRLLAVGVGLLMAGDLIWDVYELGFHVDPSPSPADAFYLAAYPLLIAGSVLLGRSRQADQARSATLDGLIAGLGASIFAWHTLVLPVFTEPGLSILERIVSSAYPISDLVLVAVVVRMIVLLRVRSVASWLLLVGFVALLASDLLFAQLQESNAYLDADWFNLGWLASYVALGASALHPSMASLGQGGAAGRGPQLGLGSLLLVAPSLAAGQLMLMSTHLGEPGAVDAVGLTVASLVVDALVILRIAGAIRGHQRAEAELADRVVHDPLTGLANRTLARDRFEQAVGRSRRDGTSVAVLHLDLDRYKVVVEELGTDAADRLLADVARRLQGVLRETDTLARLEADQFLVVSEHTEPVEGPRVLADRLLASLSAPFAGEPEDVYVRASVGVRTTTGHQSFEVVVGDAEAAMSRAKDRGRGRIEVFDPSMRSSGGSKLALETSLRRAIERGELRQLYQPVIDLATGRVVKLEALVRWEHPEQGLIPPSAFIPLAEETGLIVEMDAWGIRQACRQLQAWRDRLGDHQLRVAVNLSAQHLRDADLGTDLLTAFAASGVEPCSLCVEITETTLMGDLEASVASLAGIKSLGVEVAVDDFGTGYSSLSYLQRLPLDVLKIDRSFVQGLGEGARDRSIVAATIALAHALDLRVVAEGVETEAQLEVLRGLGCDMVQGYLFAKPLPSEEALGFVLGRQAAPTLVPG